MFGVEDLGEKNAKNDSPTVLMVVLGLGFRPLPPKPEPLHFRVQGKGVRRGQCDPDSPTSLLQGLSGREILTSSSSDRFPFRSTKQPNLARGFVRSCRGEASLSTRAGQSWEDTPQRCWTTARGRRKGKWSTKTTPQE